jgi:hypothetical protein
MSIPQLSIHVEHHEIGRFEYVTGLRLAEQHAWTRRERDTARTYFARLSGSSYGAQDPRAQGDLPSRSD